MGTRYGAEVGFRRASLMLGLKRGERKADQLRSPIRGDWRRESGPPRGFKGSASKLTRTVLISFNLLHYLPHQFFSSKKLDRGSEGSRTIKDQEKRTSMTFERRGAGVGGATASWLM
ncbi:hypothetical protein TNCV_341691 [Trichonephila clavipes]|nr:hypothetical protein TNCV_341691 [Trichonephila clavipes]